MHFRRFLQFVMNALPEFWHGDAHFFQQRARHAFRLVEERKQKMAVGDFLMGKFRGESWAACAASCIFWVNLSGRMHEDSERLPENQPLPRCDHIGQARTNGINARKNRARLLLVACLINRTVKSSSK